MLKEGSREHPVASNIAARPHAEPVARNTPGTSDVFDFRVLVISMGLAYGVDRLSGKPTQPWP
jgi:hypothetical protein